MRNFPPALASLNFPGVMAGRFPAFLRGLEVDTSFLFIPDISGFTRFVNETEVAHSQHVIAELLELIIDSDQLGLTVSELEGDAVLFHLQGRVPDRADLIEQARITFQAFHAHLKRYENHRICSCGACETAHLLSVKMVAHAGPLQMISVRGFNKPYGPDVILAHRLLKNDIPESEYLLLSDSVADRGPADLPDWAAARRGSSSYADIGEISYTYVPLTPLRASVPDPPPPPPPPRTKRPVVFETFVEKPVDDVFGLVSDFDQRHLWNPEVDEFRYEPDRVNRVGTKHECVIGGNVIEFETVTDDFGEGRIAYGERILTNPFVEDAAVYYILESEGSGTRLRQEFHYLPKAFPKSLFAPVFRLATRKQLAHILPAIKQAAEAR